MAKITKEIRFDGESFYERKDGNERCLGNISVSGNHLTREQKLIAIAKKNCWIRIVGKTIDRKSLIGNADA